MISQEQKSRTRQSGRARIGLAMAGGGPLGAMYEVGTLAALADCLDGVDLNDLDTYVGVSAGALVAAALANGIPPAEMCRIFIETEPGERERPLPPGVFMRPAFGEFARRLASLPPLIAGAIWQYLTHPGQRNVFAAFERVTRALPTGIFDGNQIDERFAETFSNPGRSNDFRKLRRKLFLVATDLESGKAVKFGAPGWDHVPISKAVQASAALPGLYPPVQIGGRYYVDGALKKTLHASVALEQGVKLVLAVNPLVPYDSDLPVTPHAHAPRRLIEGGLPAVLSQTFRSIIRSRMQSGLERYSVEYPDADIVLFEPNRDDAEVFFTNIFSYSSRRRLGEHAYQKTRKELFLRRHELAPIFARHGITLKLDVVTDPARHLVRGTRLRPLPRGPMAVQRQLEHTLGDLERWLKHHAARAA